MGLRQQGRIRAGDRLVRLPLNTLGLALPALLALSLLPACEPDPTGADAILDRVHGSVIPAIAYSPGHLAQIRVQVEGRGAGIGEARVSVEARFASFIGMDAPYVRLRADMPTPEVDLMAAGTCRSKASLAQIATELAQAPAPVDERDLSLIDVGEIQLALGEQNLDIPYALAPDWLPWMSGLEYSYQDTSMTALAVEADGPTAVSLIVQGNPESGVRPMNLQHELASPIREFSATIEDDDIVFTWGPEVVFSWPLRVEFTLAGDSMARAQAENIIVCMVDDRGAWRVKSDELREAGLQIDRWSDKTPLSVEVTRINRSLSASGAFDEIEFLLESSDRFVLRP